MSRSGISHTGYSVYNDDPYMSRTAQAGSAYWSNLEADIASRGTDWAQLIVANPYKDITRKQGLFAKIGSALGLRTSYDKFLEQQQMNSQEYISNLALKAYNEDYETPTAEAERMRAAGLNPDLLGTEGVNGASGMPEETGIDPSAFDESGDLEPIRNVVSFVTGAINMAFGLANNFQALKIAGNTVKSGNVAVAQGMQDLAMNIFKQRVPADRLKYDAHSGTWIDLMSEDREDSMDVARQMGLTGRQARNFAKQYDLLYGSLFGDAEYYSTASKKNQDKLAYYRSTLSRYYRDSVGFGSEENQEPGAGIHAMSLVNAALQDMFDELTEINADTSNITASAENAKAKNEEIRQQTLLEGMSGEIQAEGEILDADNERKQKEVNNIINKHMNDLMKNLQDSFEKDPDPWTEALIYALSIHRLLSVSGVKDDVSKAGKMAIQGIEALL